ncbi:LPS-assembly protein LptD [Aestuariibius sp. 2305UL40-4]|uniref:LPS-assembly protein LptD n=1 Tax=Aestuariibius violaceus TaxID=3234132 RepID=UPI00345E4207
MRLLLALFLLLPTLASAQGVATLVADRVFIEGEERLIAEGNVEVFYDGTRLTATRVIYDQPTDRLTLTGPVLITGPDGTILAAESGVIEPTLSNALLRGARLVLDRQLQLSANRIDRVDGRYTQLYKTSATSCAVCGDRQPLWSIRAERVIHDEAERQIYFDNAQFLIRGVPVFWIPRMRLPDPTLERSRGFLAPEIRSTNQLGTGLKLPYFIPLGPSRDITLTPYLAPGTRTLEFRYRQAFRSGDLTITGSGSSDDIRPGDLRGYVEAQGVFQIAPKTELVFDIITVSDNGYLLDYGVTGADRIESFVELTRVERFLFASGSLSNLEYLRDDDDGDADEPNLIGDLALLQRLPLGFGSELRAEITGRTVYRSSDEDGIAGRDIARLGGAIQYHGRRILRSGLSVEGDAALYADGFRITQDDAVEEDALRLTPVAAVTLRYPLMRTRPSGATEILEPALQLAWSDTGDEDLPNEDGTRPEFDEANLFSLDRLPGGDAREDGLRLNLGVTWTRYDPAGWSSTLTFGRIYRAEEADFSRTSGLGGQRSDWLISGQVDLFDGLRLANRTLVDDEGELSSSETRLDAEIGAWGLSASQIWLAADPAVDRDDPASEWAVDADYRISERWDVSANARYDLRADEPVEAGVKVGWRNECVEVDLSVSRRYTSSDTVDPTTDFDISVGLRGFSAGRSGSGPAGRCRN